MNKCRCDERLQTKTKEFTRLPYTGLVLELEHLKIETRLIIMMFASGRGLTFFFDLFFFLSPNKELGIQSVTRKRWGKVIKDPEEGVSMHAFHTHCSQDA
jgi:hypothetical protein